MLSSPGAAILMMTCDPQGVWVCIEDYYALKEKYDAIKDRHDRLAAKIPLTSMLLDIPSQSIEFDSPDIG